MQSQPQLRKWSDIQGLATVAINTGKKIGTVEDYYFDPNNNVVKAFQIKTGLFGHRVLLTKDISGLGQDALTFLNENELIKEGSELAATKVGRSLLNYRVLSEGGNVVGTVGNVILDVSTPTRVLLAAFELAGGLRSNITGKYLTFEAHQVIRYGENIIVISDVVAQGLQ
jgi:uncharacterized protein YrrD